MKTKRIVLALIFAGIVLILVLGILAIVGMKTAKAPTPKLELSQLISDLTEANASDWKVRAEDGAESSLRDDFERAKVGKTSLRLDTESGFEVCAEYKVKKGILNLSDKKYLKVWFFAENPNLGFQNNSPWIRLKNPKGNYFQYQTEREILNESLGNWTMYKIPLAGNEEWKVTSLGQVNLTEINSIEICADTWDYGFKLWIDGLSFE